MLDIILCADQKRLFPGMSVSSNLPDILLHFFGIIPGDQVILILKLPVEGTRRVPTVIRYLFYRYIFYIPDGSQFLKGFCQDFFCRLPLHNLSTSLLIDYDGPGTKPSYPISVQLYQNLRKEKPSDTSSTVPSD